MAAIAAVPMVGAGLDYVENLLVRIALSTFPDTSLTLLATSTTVTTNKLGASYLSQLLVVLGLFVAAVRWLVGRRRAER